MQIKNDDESDEKRELSLTTSQYQVDNRSWAAKDSFFYRVRRSTQLAPLPLQSDRNNEVMQERIYKLELLHCKKRGVTEHPRGAIFYCFRGNSMGYHGNSIILLLWGVPIHRVFYSVG